MTHTELVVRAEKWLGRFGCGVTLREFTTSAGEIPDAIGWKFGYSVLIECKANRADFLSDKKKHFRRYPDKGMGQYRLYMCPPGIIKEEDVKDGWGLLWAYPKTVKRVIGPCKHNYFRDDDGVKHNLEFNKSGEMDMILSALRRLKLRGHLEEIYEDLATSRARIEQMEAENE